MYTVYTTEENGLTDVSRHKSDLKYEDFKADYIATRVVQSQKGFMRPVPKDVTVEIGW